MERIFEKLRKQISPTPWRFCGEGVPEEEIMRRILTERTDWTKHRQREKYVRRTVEKAKEVITR